MKVCTIKELHDIVHGGLSGYKLKIIKMNDKSALYISKHSQNPFWKFFGPEDKIHAECVGWLKSRVDLVWAHPPNEGKRTRFEQFKATVLGITSGLMDMLIFEARNGKHGLFIELKAGKNKQSDNQKELESKLIAKGYECHVCYSSERFIEIVKHYLGEI